MIRLSIFIRNFGLASIILLSLNFLASAEANECQQSLANRSTSPQISDPYFRLHLQQFFKSIAIDEQLEPFVLSSSVDIQRVDFHKPRKRLRIQRSPSFPGFRFAWVDRPFEEQRLRVRGSVLSVPEMEVPRDDQAQFKVVEAIYEAMLPSWNLLSLPWRHNNRIAQAMRYHGERLMSLAAELRRSEGLDETQTYESNPMRRLFIRDLIFAWLPGYGYRRLVRVNEPLLGLYGEGDPDAIDAYIEGDIARGRIRGGMTWLNRNFYLALVLANSMAIASVPQAIGVSDEIGRALVEAGERLEQSETFSGGDVEMITTAEESLKRNLRFLLENYADLSVLAQAEAPPENLELMIQNLVWDVDLILAEAQRISTIRADEILRQLQDEGVIAFLNGFGHEY